MRLGCSATLQHCRSRCLGPHFGLRALQTNLLEAAARSRHLSDWTSDESQRTSIVCPGNESMAAQRLVTRDQNGCGCDRITSSAVQRCAWWSVIARGLGFLRMHSAA